ncbi:MAG: alpha/beta hydrolase [Candidatus Dormibacteraeota bacterium]|nr:alpha/beta hydrolase [Candidatus Dormibacteraeota bacterium]MBV9526517.1 alpha/beta hydrolase [Candidatus Dormibacteraeota bacterium]
MSRPVREFRVPTSGPALNVRDHEGGEPAVLTMHGLASNARWWDLVAARLAPTHRVIAVDLRGHGLSDRTDGGYDFDTVARDVAEVAAALHPGPMVVAGHSWGASVALVYGLNHPETTLGVVCVDGGATDLKAYFGPTWEMAEQTMKPPALRGVTPQVLRDWMDSSPISEGSDPETAAAILLGNFEDDGSGAGTLRPRLSLPHHMEIARHLYELDGYAVMERLRCPVLIVPAGHPDHEDAPKVRAMTRATEALGGRGSVVWVDGVHDIPVQRPDEVAAAIADFAARLA